MHSGWTILVQTVILVAALSIDTLAASLAYGATGIDIPFASAATLAGVCSATLGLSLCIGAWLCPYVPQALTRWICFCILFLLGLVKLFDASLKAAIRRRKASPRNIAFSLGKLRFLLTVYADPEQADQDDSRTLSVREAFALGTALSLDGLAVGFGAGMGAVGAVEGILISLGLNYLAIRGGCALGRRMALRCQADVGWLSGILLIGLALCKL